MMISTHMAYGFVFAFALIFILAQAFPANSVTLSGSSGYFAILGALGGIIPDLDRMEQIGMTHRKTLHYAVGWGIITLLLIGVGYSIDLTWLVGFACLFSGAWLHSFMDIFDDFYKDPKHGIYEHISRKWIRPFRWIPFASLREWSLQSFCMIGAMAISPFLAGASILQGWLIAVLVFLAIWLLSTIYEFRYSVPKRLALINEALKKAQTDKD
jgi:hypothetical protein